MLIVMLDKNDNSNSSIMKYRVSLEFGSLNLACPLGLGYTFIYYVRRREVLFWCWDVPFFKKFTVHFSYYTLMHLFIAIPEVGNCQYGLIFSRRHLLVFFFFFFFLEGKKINILFIVMLCNVLLISILWCL